MYAPAGWVNVDKSPSMMLDRIPGAKKTLAALGVLHENHLYRWPTGVKRCDITKGLPFEDGSVDAVYSSHALEHVYLDDAEGVLRECFRVLRGGGILRLALPDAEAHARSLIDEGDGRKYLEDLGMAPLARPHFVTRVVSRFGSSYHRWQPTRRFVTQLLVSAGFEDVTDREFKQGNLPDLDAVEFREESFFLEAVRPGSS
jgi:SAM-dependent methyltransferase